MVKLRPGPTPLVAAMLAEAAFGSADGSPPGAKMSGMRWALVALLVVGSAFPAEVHHVVTAAELEQYLSQSAKTGDRDVARELYAMQLDQYLRAERVEELKSKCAREQCRRAVVALAGQAAFIESSSASDAPDMATQKAIAAKLVDFAVRYSHELPNLIATRTMTRFQDRPEKEFSGAESADSPIQFVRETRATITYRHDNEVITHEKVVADQNRKEHNSGLEATGLFGVLLRTVILDSSRSTLMWDRWDHAGTEPVAVFRFTVPMEKSRYQVRFCCIQGSKALFSYIDRFSAYHGEIAVHPEDGSIDRIRLIADLEKGDVSALMNEAVQGYPLSRADLFVEYRPVSIGGKSYVCPIHAIAISRAKTMQEDKLRGASMGPPQTYLNDVTFTDYHIFRSESRILPEWREQ